MHGALKYSLRMLSTSPSTLPNSSKTFHVLAAFIVAALMICPTQAALILYEGFDYSPIGTNVAGQSGGTGAWSGAWDTRVGTSTTGLTYSGLQTTGNALLAGNTFQNSRSWDTTGVGADGTSNWFSGLVTVTSDTGQNRFLFSTGSSNEGFGFEAIGSGGNYTIVARADGVNGSSASSAVTQNVTSLVIGRIDWSDSGNELVSIWVNPADFSSVAALGVATSTASDEVDNFGQFYPRNANATAGQAIYDEIRLGTTLADVTPVPEPSSLAFLASAGAGLFLLRRRQRS